MSYLYFNFQKKCSSQRYIYMYSISANFVEKKLLKYRYYLCSIENLCLYYLLFKYLINALKYFIILCKIININKKNFI